MPPLSGSRDCATRTYYEITLDYENPITGEPHIHYLADDPGKAQAFIYTVAELIGSNYWINTFEWHESSFEPPQSICISCSTARHDFVNRLADELAPRRSVSALRPPDV